ncbi:papilin isoform X2 [Octopus vulgaris]|uniref:Papilin isoform X2 n=2 Tax=Octopus vulgaris TaxID=6645 RepID=A0AA36FPG7_OCTVU|nr:papilin isoform X2 [Octopus vulgaris]
MFVYGGCGGNANRFATFEECRLRCGSSIEWTPYTPFTIPATTMTTTELRVVSTRYCHLKEEVGSCTDIMYKWYYNMGEGRCKKFLYSGCGGNNNRYESKEECEKICQPKDMCSLPKETGICYSYSEQYYFNMVTRQCEQFVYGGCGGNANRFASIYKCEQLCSAFVVKPMTTTPYTTWTPTMPKNVCQLPKEPGNCYSYSEQYFFNNKLGRCERFVYGGCGGNANRFATFLECRNKCEPKTTPPIFTFITSRTPKPVPTVNQTKPTPKPEVCHLQKIVGPCSSRITAWYHDSLQDVCSQFKYSGCGGNQNNFKTREECERACKPMKDLCDLPRNTGRCHNVTRRWHFSKKDNKCIRFAFTGCGGNANNFETEDECRKACKAPGESAKDVCHFAKKIGSCKGAIPSWYYDMSVGQCMKFLYGGCEGNKNRFRMKHECEATCNKKDICRLPEDSGICYAYSTAYFYDSNMKKCRKFVYGGCGGNANRFPTMGACYNLCGPNATTPRNHTGPVIPGPISAKQPMKCKLPATTGSCQDIRRMWYYDHVKEQCDQFFYSGCGGNGNRFHTELECLASCRVKAGPEMRPPTVFTLPPFLTVTPTNNIIKLGVDLKKKVVLQCGEAVGYSVTWSHNGKDIFPDNRHDIRGWELVIHDVDYKDVGLYTCRRNDDITDTPLERYQLNIKDSLQLIIDKSPARFHEGDTIKLKCHTNGYPYTELKWYHRSYPVRSQGRITANEGSLMINRAAFSDSGIYTCKGKYQNEQVGKDVRVHVLPKPNEVSDECLNVQDVLPTLQCRIIVTSQLCDQRAFRTQCCASCKKHRNVIS